MARTAVAVPHVQQALLLRGCPEVQQGAVQVEAEQSALLLRAAEAITVLQDYARRVDTLKEHVSSNVTWAAGMATIIVSEAALQPWRLPLHHHQQIRRRSHCQLWPCNSATNS